MTAHLMVHRVGYEWVFTGGYTAQQKKALLKNALSYSPLGVSVYAWEQNEQGLYVKPEGVKDSHWCTLYNINADGTYQIFDSYNKTLKTLAPDYDFGFAMRYHIEKLAMAEIPTQINTIQLNLLQQWLELLLKWLNIIKR